MPNYKKMYFDLFNKVSSAVNLLQQAQSDSEEQYISAEPVQLAQNRKPPKISRETRQI